MPCCKGRPDGPCPNGTIPSTPTLVQQTFSSLLSMTDMTMMVNFSTSTLISLFAATFIMATVIGRSAMLMAVYQVRCSTLVVIRESRIPHVDCVSVMASSRHRSRACTTSTGQMMWLRSASTTPCKRNTDTRCCRSGLSGDGLTVSVLLCVIDVPELKMQR